MKIDYLALKKICIAQGLLDPHLLWNAFSNFTKKRAEKMLKEIQSKHAGNPPAVEQEVASLIEKTWAESPRKRRMAFILLMIAKNESLISLATYKRLRETMGVTEYSPEVKQELAPQEKKQDIFEVLMGNAPASQSAVTASKEIK